MLNCLFCSIEIDWSCESKCFTVVQNCRPFVGDETKALSMGDRTCIHIYLIAGCYDLHNSQNYSNKIFDGLSESSATKQQLNSKSGGKVLKHINNSIHIYFSSYPVYISKTEILKLIRKPGIVDLGSTLPKLRLVLCTRSPRRWFSGSRTHLQTRALRNNEPLRLLVSVRAPRDDDPRKLICLAV